jgi:opacity protein-like surface antigen
MKRLIALAVVALFLASTAALAQPIVGKKWEFSTAVAFNSTKYTGESASSYLNIPVRVGYFIWKGLEIEPELTMTFTSDDIDLGTGLFFSLNAAYNFTLTNKKLIPFVRAGFGLGNGIRQFDLIFKTSGYTITAPSLGLGAKYRIGDSAALRLEYRFNSYSASGGVGHFVDEHLVFVGISIFF